MTTRSPAGSQRQSRTIVALSSTRGRSEQVLNGRSISHSGRLQLADLLLCAALILNRFQLTRLVAA